MANTFIGDRIRSLRGRRTRLDIQRETGVSEATLLRAEKAGVVSRRTAERLADAFGVSPEELQAEELQS